MMTSSRVSVWVLASRPRTLPAALAPVLIGSAMAMADGAGHLWSALAAGFGALMIQVGTNFTNDYYDFKKGADRDDRLGPMRVTQAGLVSPSAMIRAIAITFGLAFLAGIYLVSRGGWPIIVIGLLSILFGVLYTAGPFSLSYTGLADIFVLVFFGPVAAAGTYYVQSLQINSTVILAGLSPGLLSMAILTVNNLRDVESDRNAGKKSVVVRFGKTFARLEYMLLVVFASLLPVYLVFKTNQHHYALAAALTLLPAIPCIKTVFRTEDGPSLNDALANTGRLLLIYSLLFSMGWLI
jgi:1,4-dihydroxy-2-naphthoate octaprenyltransferase